MNPVFTTMNLWFLLGALGTAIALGGIVLRWLQRQGTKHGLDPSGLSFGLHALACWTSLIILLLPAAAPLWQTLDRSEVMGLRTWEVAKFFAFFVGCSIICWLLVTRLSYFVYFWVFQERLLRTSVKEGKNGLVLTWAGVLLFLSYMMTEPLAQLYLGFIPYPELPSFN